MTVLAVLALGMSYAPQAVAQTIAACPASPASISTQEICWINVGTNPGTVEIDATSIAWRMPANVNHVDVRVDHDDTTRMYHSRDHFMHPNFSNAQGNGIEVSTSASKPGNDDWNGFCRTHSAGSCSDWWGDSTSDGAVIPSDLARVGGVTSSNRVYIYPTDGRLCHEALGVFDGYYTEGETGTYRMCLQGRIKIEYGNTFQYLWIRDNHNGPTSVSTEDTPETTNTWRSDSGCTQQGSTQKGNYLLICWPGTSVGVGMTDPYVSGHALDCFTNGTCREYPSGAWTWQSSGDYTPTPPNDCYVPAQTLEHGQTITCHNGSIS